MFNRINGQKGFTLLELAVVVLIVAFMAAVLIPKSFDFANQAKDAKVKEAVATANEAERMRWAFNKLNSPNIDDATMDNDLWLQTGGPAGIFNTGSFSIVTSPALQVGNNVIDCGFQFTANRVPGDLTAPGYWEFVSIP